MRKILLLFSLLIASIAATAQDTTVVGFTTSADPNFKNTIAVDIVWSVGPPTFYRGTATNRIIGAYGSLKQGTVSIQYTGGTVIIGPKKPECQ